MRLTDRRVPLPVAQAIVEARVRVSLAPPTTYSASSRVFAEERAGAFDPAPFDLAVAVDELDKPCIGPSLQNPTEAFVSRTGGGEGACKIELHNLGIQIPSKDDAPVARAAVDVNYRNFCGYGLQAPAQALSLVSADRHNCKTSQIRQVGLALRRSIREFRL